MDYSSPNQFDQHWAQRIVKEERRLMEKRISNDKYYVTDFKPTKYSEGIDEPISYKKHSNTAIESPSIAKRPEHYKVFESRPRYAHSPSPVPSAVPNPQFRLPERPLARSPSPTTIYSRFSRVSKGEPVSEAKSKQSHNASTGGASAKDREMIRSLMKELDAERERRLQAEQERDVLKKTSPVKK